MVQNLPKNETSPLVTNRWFVNFAKSLKNYSRDNPVFFLFLLLMLPLTVFAIQSTVSYLSKAQTANTVKIAFAPETVSLPGNKNIKIMMESGNGNVGFARIVFTFDKNKVRLTSEITTHPQLPTVIEKTTMANANAKGKAVIVVAASGIANLPSGNFEFAAFSLDSISANIGSSAVNFEISDIQIVNLAQILLAPQVFNLKINSTALATIAPTTLALTPTSPPSLPGDKVAVRFSPGSVTLPPNQNIKIMLDSYLKDAPYARIDFTFDKSKINLAGEITTSPLLPAVIQKSSMQQANTQGRATIIIASGPHDIRPKGQFEYASFAVKAVSAGIDKTSINFDPGQTQIVTSAEYELIPEFSNLEINGNAPSPDVVSVRFSDPLINLPPDINEKIILNSPKQIAFARVVFTFDKSKVRLKSEITTGPKLKTVVQKTSMADANNSGRAVIVVAAAPGDTKPSGDFEIASLILGAVSPNIGKTTVDFASTDFQIVDALGKILQHKTVNILVNSGTPPTITSSPVNQCKIVSSIACYRTWVREYTGRDKTKIADLNKDGKVDLNDFEIYRRAANP